MGKNFKKSSLFLVCSLALSQLQAQLVVNGGTLTINSNAFISVQGNLTSNTDILGAGKIVMSGTTPQELNTNGFAIPNLEINTTSEVQLTGNSKVTTNLNFVAGKIKTGNFDLVLDNAATATGYNATRFIWTNGTGQLKKNLSANVTNLELPVGENTNYRPAYLTTTGSTFTNANFGVRVGSGKSPNMPPKIENAVNSFWTVSRTGITGGTVRLEGQYTDADIVGNESALSGYYFNGTDWSSASETHNEASNRISALIAGSTGQLTGMNKFVAVGARAFLQGPYNASTGLMADLLRSGTPMLIPFSDPYRTATYSAFAHVANTTPEVANASVFATQAQADNNIVDWVFLELRNTNASPGNVVLQTRSALIQRDGDIVDIDGVSPVTFNNVTNGTYGISVRHRNHLGMSFNPSTSARTFTETGSTAFTANVADFRTAPQSQLFGTAANHKISTHPTLGNAVSLLWAGNANLGSGTIVRFSGINNDKDPIILSAGNATGLNNIYHIADINLNRRVNYSGINNDKDVLYSIVGNTTQVSGNKTQALPN